ncbi:MAG: hypothetical protein ABIE22_00910 [archaeon]
MERIQIVKLRGRRKERGVATIWYEVRKEVPEKSGFFFEEGKRKSIKGLAYFLESINGEYTIEMDAVVGEDLEAYRARKSQGLENYLPSNDSK